METKPAFTHTYPFKNIPMQFLPAKMERSDRPLAAELLFWSLMQWLL